ncbi:MAG: coproporphyrinogen III oxidase, partial [Bacteroidales bacterium]|nr:coproporphyrinogen III oxidase [Bacteroidales bacterium]
ECLAPTKFQQYEVSNYCLPGFESRHNSAYWDHTSYLGLGPAAHSFDGTSRQWNPANLKQYMENVADGRLCEEREALSPTDLYNETLLLALRTREGLDLQSIRIRYGEERAQDIVNHFRERVPAGQYENTAGKLRLTAEGLWFADGIAENLFNVD